MKKITKSELVCYSIGTIAFVIGLVFSCLGIAADHLSTTSVLKKLQGNFSWRYLGIIIIGCAVIFLVIVLLINSKKIDRVNEKANRRKQRLNAMMSDAKLTNDTMVVSEGKLVKEEKVETIDNASDIKDEDIKPTNQ